MLAIETYIRKKYKIDIDDADGFEFIELGDSCQCGDNGRCIFLNRPEMYRPVGPWHHAIWHHEMTLLAKHTGAEVSAPSQEITEHLPEVKRLSDEWERKRKI